jgi:hypothetical protein
MQSWLDFRKIEADMVRVSRYLAKLKEAKTDQKKPTPDPTAI